MFLSAWPHLLLSFVSGVLPHCCSHCYSPVVVVCDQRLLLFSEYVVLDRIRWLFPEVTDCRLYCLDHSMVFMSSCVEWMKTCEKRLKLSNSVKFKISFQCFFIFCCSISHSFRPTDVHRLHIITNDHRYTVFLWHPHACTPACLPLCLHSLCSTVTVSLLHCCV